MRSWLALGSKIGPNIQVLLNGFLEVKPPFPFYFHQVLLNGLLEVEPPFRCRIDV